MKMQSSELDFKNATQLQLIEAFKRIVQIEENVDNVIFSAHNHLCEDVEEMEMFSLCAPLQSHVSDCMSRTQFRDVGQPYFPVR